MAERAKSLDLDVIEELQHDRKMLIETKSRSNDIIREHEKIIKATDAELFELEVALQFHRKRYLRENPGAVAESGQVDQPISGGNKPMPELTATTATDDYVLSPLDNAMLKILDSYNGERISIRTITQTLTDDNFPTRATDFATFSTVVGNALRRLEENKKVGLEQTGRFVKYYSLKAENTHS